MRLEPRACAWTGQVFRPAYPGQLFANREAALAFERSGYTAMAIDPARAKSAHWFQPKAPESLQNTPA